MPAPHVKSSALSLLRTASTPAPRATFRAILGAAAVLAAVGVLSACAAVNPVDPVDPMSPDAAPPDPDDWVVVTFGTTEGEFDLEVMNSMLSTELAADNALRAAEAGWIDGNEVGDHQYDLYFVGYDREEMWALLEPVFASAPLPWTRVELRDSLEDPAAMVITP